MGNYNYACFISYKHPPSSAPSTHFYNEFVRAFRSRLEEYLTSHERTYCDTTLEPGESYPSVLAERLCQSACLIAVLTPDYANSAWCLAEWEAMERLEARRLGGQRELIIPVVFRGEPRHWENQYKRRPIDLRVDAPREQLATIRNRQKIGQIAERVDNWLAVLKRQQHADTGCRGFAIDVGAEEDQGRVVHAEPNALGWG